MFSILLTLWALSCVVKFGLGDIKWREFLPFLAIVILIDLTTASVAIFLWDLI